PAEQGKKIAKRGGNKTRVAVSRQRDDCAVNSFRQLLSAGREDEREVGEARDGRAERLIDKNLLVSIRQVVLPAYDMRDAHLDVVANDREVIQRMPVRAQQHEVFDLGVVARLLAV